MSDRSVEPSAMRSSGRSTAKGSSPTWKRAMPTAWPSPRGSSWRTKWTCAIWLMARISASASSLPPAASVASSSGERSKWSSTVFLDRPVTMRTSSMPAATASSTTYWIPGLSTRGIISLGVALVAGRKRVPRPAAGMTALRTRMPATVRTPRGVATGAGLGRRAPAAEPGRTAHGQAGRPRTVARSKAAGRTWCRPPRLASIGTRVPRVLTEPPMPTYVYKFLDTGETIEVQQSFDEPTLTEAPHPTDGVPRPVKKVFTPVGITFKGNGFYKTDSRGSKNGASAASILERLLEGFDVGLVRLVGLVGLVDVLELVGLVELLQLVQVLGQGRQQHEHEHQLHLVSLSRERGPGGRDRGLRRLGVLRVPHRHRVGGGRHAVRPAGGRAHHRHRGRAPGRLPPPPRRTAPVPARRGAVPGQRLGDEGAGRAQPPRALFGRLAPARSPSGRVRGARPARRPHVGPRRHVPRRPARPPRGLRRSV